MRKQRSLLLVAATLSTTSIHLMPKQNQNQPTKKQESAGISKAERDELDKLKTDIIARKAELKGTGMSGGQINKDEHVVIWVKRMNELKEKECPGSTTTKKGREEERAETQRRDP